LTLTERLDVLSELGQYLQSGGDAELDAVIQRAESENRWFTAENTREALKAIADAFLDRDKLVAWTQAYPVPVQPFPAKTIGVVMAGNIPLVGFHDWLCIFVCGYRARVKLSEKDKALLPFLVKKMGEWAPESWAYTEFLSEGDRMTGIDAMIATGSNNSARYFEQYFAQYPHIIRRNRNAVAVLSGQETTAEMYALGRDIFAYFGLGCRNVSKLYVPRGYQFDALLEALHAYREIVNHDKYKNNFDYNLTLLLLNNVPYHNNGCLLLHEDPSLLSRIASLHYEYYESPADLEQKLAVRQDEIQCVIGNLSLKNLPILQFGHSQQPGLRDYPDGVDVMGFLCSLELNKASF